MATEFHGTIYNAGDIIPGYVDDPIQSMTWWDDSKTYQEYDETSVYQQFSQIVDYAKKVNPEVLDRIIQRFITKIC